MSFNSSNPNELKAEAERLLQQGTERYQSKQLEAAIASWKQAETIYRSLQDLKNEGVTFNNIGLVYMELENYTEGIKAYEESLTIARTVKNRQMELNRIVTFRSSFRCFKKAYSST